MLSSWAWQQEVDDPSAKLVLVKLADSANDDGVCWPSHRKLARDCGLSDAQHPLQARASSSG